MSDQAQTFLDRGTRFEGRILVTGVVRLDGYFKGDGRAQGTLVIGESGEIEAELEVDRFVVHGSFTGNVFAKERVEIGPTGRVHGSVTTPCLRVQDGALVTARIHMGEAARRPVAPQAPKAAPEKSKLEPAPVELVAEVAAVSESADVEATELSAAKNPPPTLGREARKRG